jgi:hypothetical protein
LKVKKFRWPWAKKNKEEEIGSIEAMLESLYTPVNARPAFVDDLRQKLVGVRGPLGVASRSTLELVLLIGGAIIGAVLFIFAAVRSIISLVAGVRQIGGNVKEKRNSKKKTTAAQSATAKK